MGRLATVAEIFISISVVYTARGFPYISCGLQEDAFNYFGLAQNAVITAKIGFAKGPQILLI